jgi:hypothetical protein
MTLPANLLFGSLNPNAKRRRLLSITVKSKPITVTGRGGPSGCETSRLPHFLDSPLTDGARFSALHAGGALPQKDFLVLISATGGVNPRA